MSSRLRIGWGRRGKLFESRIAKKENVKREIRFAVLFLFVMLTDSVNLIGRQDKRGRKIPSV
jgi:hypothetical protein